MTIRYEWYLFYSQQGKTYVLDRFETYDPNEARRNHEHSCAFHWATPEMEQPRVSALEAVDGRGRVRIRESCAPGQDPKRVYKAVPPPENLRLDYDTMTVVEPPRVEAPPTPTEAPSAPAEAPTNGHPWDG